MLYVKYIHKLKESSRAKYFIHEGLIMKYKINRKNHHPAKKTLDRGQGCVIGVVDTCLCANHEVILI